MSEHGDARLQRVAMAMRQAFFVEFGDIETMPPEEIEQCIITLAAIHAGELLEFAARFSSGPIIDTAIYILNQTLSANAGVIAEIIGDRDQRAYLAGAPE